MLPECRPQFLQALQKLLRTCCGVKVRAGLSETRSETRNDHRRAHRGTHRCGEQPHPGPRGAPGQPPRPHAPPRSTDGGRRGSGGNPHGAGEPPGLPPGPRSAFGLFNPAARHAAPAPGRTLRVPSAPPGPTGPPRSPGRGTLSAVRSRLPPPCPRVSHPSPGPHRLLPPPAAHRNRAGAARPAPRPPRGSGSEADSPREGLRLGGLRDPFQPQPFSDAQSIPYSHLSKERMVFARPALGPPSGSFPPAFTITSPRDEGMPLQPQVRLDTAQLLRAYGAGGMGLYGLGRRTEPQRAVVRGSSY